jgi:hypothetical protein
MQLLEGLSGKTSSMRVWQLGISFTIILVWAVISIGKMELQPFSEFQVALILGTGVMKAWQRRMESAPADPPTPPNPSHDNPPDP